MRVASCQCACCGEHRAEQSLLAVHLWLVCVTSVHYPRHLSTTNSTVRTEFLLEQIHTNRCLNAAMWQQVHQNMTPLLPFGPVIGYT